MRKLRFSRLSDPESKENPASWLCLVVFVSTPPLVASNCFSLSGLKCSELRALLFRGKKPKEPCRPPALLLPTAVVAELSTTPIPTGIWCGCVWEEVPLLGQPGTKETPVTVCMSHWHLTHDSCWHCLGLKPSSASFLLVTFVKEHSEPRFSVFILLIVLAGKKMHETSLMVQWLRLGTSTAGSVGSISGWGTKIPHAL